MSDEKVRPTREQREAADDEAMVDGLYRAAVEYGDADRADREERAHRAAMDAKRVLLATLATLRSECDEALAVPRERIDAHDLAERGGEWLGVARDWIKWHARNGSDVTWGSHDALECRPTVAQIEALAADVAAAAMRPQPNERSVSSSLRARWKAEMELDAARSALAEMSGAVERSAALVRSFYQDGDALDVTVGVVVDALGHARAALDGANREIVASRSILAGEGRELSDVLAENASLRSALAASERECDRWRHGVPVEGDYVCPDSLALAETRAALAECQREREAMERAAANALRELTDARDGWSETRDSFFDRVQAVTRLSAALTRATERGERMAGAVRALDLRAEETGYGFYHPDNPHDFHPDEESCTPQEIANHKAACDAYDAGARVDPPEVHQHVVSDDGKVVASLLITPWGIGSYALRDEKAAEVLAALAAWDARDAEVKA